MLNLITSAADTSHLHKMKERKNILFITAIFPYPLTSGGAQAQFGIMNELRKEHNLIVMFNQDRVNTLDKMKQLSELWPDVKFIPYPFRTQMLNLHFLFNMVKRGFQTFFTPDSTRFQIDRAIRSVSIYQSKRLERFINRIIDEYSIDIVQTEFYPTIGLVSCLPDKVRKVFIQHEIHYIKNERLFQHMNLNRRERKRFRKSREFEIASLNAYDVVVTLTAKDKELLEESGVRSEIYVSPAAVITKDHPYLEYDGRLTFLGGSTHTPNSEGVTWLIDEVMPLLKTERKPMLDLIGKGWDGVKKVDGLEIHTHGYVENLPPVLRGSVMVVPILSGSGMRMKILEAAANSVPIITTTVGVEGLDFVNGESCLIADTPADFAAAIDTLVNDKDMRRRLGENAHDVYMAKYTAKSLAQVRNQLYLR